MMFYPVQKVENQWEVLDKVEGVVPTKVIKDLGPAPEEVFDAVKAKLVQSGVSYLK